LYAGDKASGLQALRRNLYERIVFIDQRSQENRLRMHAAYNVSSAILQHLGLSQQEQTYSPRTSG
ncbi:MAG: flagellar protein FlgN, partial [Mariprofundaceae bacterium]